LINLILSELEVFIYSWRKRTIFTGSNFWLV